MKIYDTKGGNLLSLDFMCGIEIFGQFWILCLICGKSVKHNFRHMHTHSMCAIGSANVFSLYCWC